MNVGPQTGRRRADNRPLRGTRPRNRRSLIVDAATELFFDRGYGNVAMSDVAEAVAVGPSALYRHFQGKHDLLFTVVYDALSTVATVIDDADTSRDLAEVLAEVSLRQRKVGVLWRRESRHLREQERRRIRVVTTRLAWALADRVSQLRPGLSADDSVVLARCALAVANSVSFHTRSLPEPAMTALMAQLIDVALWVPVGAPTSGSPVESPAFATGGSRREAILGAATRLFAERGFTGVSMDDIGAAVGIAGPSIYNHFPAKTGILAAVMVRGEQWLREDFERAADDADGPVDLLGRLLAGYQTFAFCNPHVVQALLSETGHLLERDARSARRAQRAYITDWVRVARQAQPDWSADEAQIRVQAAQMLINETAISRRLRRRSDIERIVATVGLGLLELTPG